MFQPCDPVSAVRWLAFRNDASETAPGFALLRATGVTTVEEALVLTVGKPNSLGFAYFTYRVHRKRRHSIRETRESTGIPAGTARPRRSHRAMAAIGIERGNHQYVPQRGPTRDQEGDRSGQAEVDERAETEVERTTGPVRD